MKGEGASADLSGRRLDQWLWFARLAKSRSLAARLCVGGAVTVNQVTTIKANHLIRIGDTITVPQGAFRRTVRVLRVGARRGPAAEAQLLYQEVADPARLSNSAPTWVPLILLEDGEQRDNTFL